MRQKGCWNPFRRKLSRRDQTPMRQLLKGKGKKNFYEAVLKLLKKDEPQKPITSPNISKYYVFPRIDIKF